MYNRNADYIRAGGYTGSEKAHAYIADRNLEIATVDYAKARRHDHAAERAEIENAFVHAAAHEAYFPADPYTGAGDADPKIFGLFLAVGIFGTFAFINVIKTAAIVIATVF